MSSWPQAMLGRQGQQRVAAAVSIGAACAATGLFLLRRQQADVRKPSKGKGSADDGEVISWKEVGWHKRLDSVWIVLHGEVFDVTSWMEDHPGGSRLLLAFAGRDATEAFESIGHSALARRELRRLRLGKVGGSHGGWAEAPDRKRPAVKLTGGCRSSTVVSAEAPDEKLWEVCSNGFLPCRDPAGMEVLKSTPFQAFADLADYLPALGITGEFRTFLDADVELQKKLQACGNEGVLDDMTEDQLERAFGAVSYVMVAYWRSGILAFGTGVVSASTLRMPMDAPKARPELPPFLSEPLLSLSKRLERPPMVDYAASVLYNWVRIDPEGPMSTSNIRMIHRFTGLLDEEWFFKTHVIIESEAASAVSALLNATQAASFGELLTHLVTLEEALWRVVRAGLPIMYERSRDGIPHCSEHIFYHVLRPLISSGSLIVQDQDGKGGTSEIKITGPSGAMSSLLPCVDACLGIKTSSQRLRQALDLFEQSMPKEHRQLLETLRSKPPIRTRIQHGAPRDTELYEALTRSFNRCIARVLDFRWQHWQYVKNFIMKPGNISYAVGSGGTTFDYLQQHITDTQEARLAEKGEFITRMASPAEPDMLMVSRDLATAPVAYQRSLELWSVDGVNGLLARQPMRGLEEEWVEALPESAKAAVKVLWSLCKKMPALCAAEGPFLAQVEAASEDLAPLRSHESLMSISEVALERLMTMLTHAAAACAASEKKTPKCIERPLQLVARALGRPPKLNFTELVLSNWTETSPEGVALMEIRELPETKVESESEPEAAPKLHMVLRFLACPDEEWYRATHMLLHKEAREVVAAIRLGQVAARECNTETVVESLSKLTTWLNEFCDYFDGHFENKDSRSESVSFGRLSQFVAKDMEECEVHCWVYASGGSVLLPAIHAYLGVQMWATSENETLDEQVGRYAVIMRRFMEESRVYMPRLHRVFLEDLERPGSSIRQFAYRRFGAKSVSVEGLHTLEVSYNDCLNALTRFLSRRTRLVSRFFPSLESTFSRLHTHVEEQMRKSRLKLLQMRQNVDRCLEK